MAMIEKSKLKDFKVIREIFDKHKDDINWIFENEAFNAKAENLNSKIQQFLSNNFDTKDKDFFFYRTQVYFT